MTAKIIPFPIAFRIPENWTGTDEYMFDYFREGGMSIEDAISEVETGRAIRNMKPRFPGDNVLLRQAVAEIAQAPKRKP